METLTSWLKWSAPETSNFQQKSDIRFFIHDEEHIVKAEHITPTTLLIEYLREVAHLTGTKFMCLEGGCGSCVVAVSFEDVITKEKRIISVNSCLIPLYKVYGWKIYVVDKIGKKSYHPIQLAVEEHAASQCGFCTSGMVMNMYALYRGGKPFTMRNVERSFGGNICRCTGYRSILDAFKTFASDHPNNSQICDIEDVSVCKKDKEKCSSSCKKKFDLENQCHFFQNLDVKWYRAFSFLEVLDIVEIAVKSNKLYMLVGGNTATGVYRRSANIQIFIDIGNVKPLVEYEISDTSLILGASKTLTDTIDIFEKLAIRNPRFIYFGKVADHMLAVANPEVRNVATLAGNLMTKHTHHEFPSDIFLLLETCAATLTLVGIDRREITMNLLEFLKFDMTGVVIKNITIVLLTDQHFFESYKVMPIAQNSVGYVNSGFILALNKENIVQRARIVYGGINPNFVHATNLEKYLINKNIFTNETLQGAFQTLDNELFPNYVLPDPTPEFRKQLAIALFYKFILSIVPDHLVSPYYKTGGIDLPNYRGLSSGTQSYGTTKSKYPLTKAMPKLETLAQTSGKIKYIPDIPDAPHQLDAAFVLARAPANSIITKVDPSKALDMVGVFDYIDKNDIPGINNFMPKAAIITNVSVEEVFCNGTVKYYNQPVGLIIAKDRKLAEEAAELVEITYRKGKRKPLLTIRDLLASEVHEKIILEGKIESTRRGNDVKHVVKGKLDYSFQYHYHLETQCCIALPTEDGITLYPSTQDVNNTQVAAATFLNIPVNKVIVEVQRLGAGYGGKISRNAQVSCAAALAAYKLQKPIKIHMSFEANMDAIGKRYPISADYEVGVDDKGVIQYLEGSLYLDYGASGGNENVYPVAVGYIAQQYNVETWNLSIFSTRTDTHTSTWCRGPGSFDAQVFLENVMQHIATEINQNPTQVRLLNINNTELYKYVKDVTEWADVKKRTKAVNEFNKMNRWMKKGICVVPMRFNAILQGPWAARVSIFEGDGSVSLSHGGVEIGQGINTKAAQMCAFTLGIPLDQVSVKPNSTTFTLNNRCTGFSITSDSVCHAVLRACQILNERIKPIRNKLPQNTAWRDIIKECYNEQVDLSASFLHQLSSPDIQLYSIYGAGCVEVTVDILTGFVIIERVDIIEDVGDSLNPTIDIGQIEGAFVMGLSFWICERMVFDEDGKLLTNRTWTFKVAGARDIPVEFNVKIPKNNPNKLSIVGSKGVGEPAICLSIAVPLAIRNAIASARKDSNPKSKAWYDIEGPSNIEDNFMHSFNNYKQYLLTPK